MAGQSPAEAVAEAKSPADGRRAERAPPARGDACIAGAVAAVALVSYALTLAPGLLKADSGEFQTLAVTLGYSHPTGYPVYLLLAKLATMIPFGDAAYRVNLLSAIMASAAVGTMYLLGRLLTGRRWIPVAGSLALAFSPAFWSQAILAEVYTSGAFCTLLILLWLGLWQQTGEVRWLFAGACLGGVSLGVHTTVAFMLPGALLFVLFHPRRWKANWTAAISGAATGAALTLAAFAVIDRADSPCSYFRTTIDPSRSEWDLRPEDTDEFLERVALSMTAPQFQSMLFSQTPERTWQKTVQYLENLPRELPPLWLAAVVAGLFWLGRRNWKMLLLLALTFSVHLAYDLQLDGVVWVLYISTYVLIVPLGVAGLAWLDEKVSRVFRARQPSGLPGRSPRRPSPCGDRALAFLGTVVVVWPMFWADAWDEEGRRACWVPPEERDAVGVDYSAKFHLDVRLLVANLEDDAIVFTGWNHVYPYYYVAHVEQGRTGIVILFDYPGRYPSPQEVELADSALAYVRRVKQVTPQRPVYFTHYVGKVARFFEMQRVYEGLEPLYRVGRPVEPD